MGKNKPFNEETLREMIAKQWGEHGAAMDVYDDLVKLAKGNMPLWLKNKNLQEQLRAPHGIIVWAQPESHETTGTTDGIGSFIYDTWKVYVYRYKEWKMTEYGFDSHDEALDYGIYWAQETYKIKIES